MTAFGIDRETLLDLTVNAVPLAIILLFAVVAVVVAPIGRGTLFTELVELGLLAVPFVVLALVSYIAGRAVMLDEDREGRAEARGPPGTVELYPDGETERAGVEGEVATGATDVESEHTDDEADAEESGPVPEREP